VACGFSGELARVGAPDAAAHPVGYEPEREGSATKRYMPCEDAILVPGTNGPGIGRTRNL
jgi:hypothetical protein